MFINAADGLIYLRKSDNSIIVVNPPQDITYNGTTPYASSTTARFVATGVTDSNGRVVFNLTKEGTATGTAIFSKIFGVQATAMATSTTDVTLAPFAVIEAQTTKTVTIRALTGLTLLLLSNTTKYQGAGFTISISVEGAI